ncbi:HET-domain-containing protein [Penicillium herquei]|nr:HET-domain-containing protein [Penicillium herquei]
MMKSEVSKGEPTSESFFPTRLIDVGDGTHHPRLVVSETYPPLLEASNNRYVALSYCWGSGEDAKHQFTTAKTTLNDRLHCIELETLARTRTLYDAVLTCRTLGFRYLWIDSLCIIQDDEVDWQKESVKMAEIYSKAFLTICVIRGGSCLTGFLDRPPSQRVVNMPFQSSVDPSVKEYILFREV